MVDREDCRCQRKDDDGEEECQVSEVNHSAREGRVVVLKQYPIEHKTTQRAADETDNLALAERRAEQTYCHKRTAQKNQPDKRPDERSTIQIAHRFRHVSHYEIVYETWQQSD